MMLDLTNATITTDFPISREAWMAMWVDYPSLAEGYREMAAEDLRIANEWK